MKVCAIVQARMNSSRLPGKVLRPVLGKPLLGYEMERLRRSVSVDGLVVATSVNVLDDPIAQFCRQQAVFCFRGPEGDVLKRFYEAAVESSAKVIVRICADSPLVDPGIVDKIVSHYLRCANSCDYASNVLKRTYPRGLDCEVFSFKALEEAYHEATQKSEREHVTPFIYNRPERYRLASVLNETDESAYRWTVDTEEDFELIEKILGALYPLKPVFDMRDVLNLYIHHPEWRQINQHVQQRLT